MGFWFGTLVDLLLVGDCEGVGVGIEFVSVLVVGILEGYIEGSFEGS